MVAPSNNTRSSPLLGQNAVYISRFKILTDALDSAKYKFASTPIHEQTNATRASDNKRKTALQLMVEIPKHRCMLSPEEYSRDMTVSAKRMRIPKNDNCSYCQQGNTDDTQCLQCSCQRWYHRYCAEITHDAEWLRLQHSSVDFRCHLC